MKFSEADFLSCVDTINERNYDYGNDILYRNCSFDHLPAPDSGENAAKLSSMIWLIGKAYSADPIRSAVKGTFANKGLGSSFETIAKGIHTSGNYADFHHRLQKLCETRYSYQYEKDRDILRETADLVSMLNGMITRVMKQAADAKGLKTEDTKNVVSFSSKFLHFMCPHLFFITDSYSFNGGVALFSGKADRTLYIAEHDSDRNIDIGKEARAYFKAHPAVAPRWAEDLENEKKDSYFVHCLRCYHLACFLHGHGKTCKLQIDGDPDSGYMPRLVDSILMRITE